MFPQAMGEGQVGDKGGFAEIAFVEHAASLYIAAGQELAAALIDLFAEILEIIVG